MGSQPCEPKAVGGAGWKGEVGAEDWASGPSLGGHLQGVFEQCGGTEARAEGGVRKQWVVSGTPCLHLERFSFSNLEDRKRNLFQFKNLS